MNAKAEPFSPFNAELFRETVQHKTRWANSRIARILELVSLIRPLRSFAIRQICLLEGGQIWSNTFRKLMFRYHQVEIGIHSYGPALFPGSLPPGTKVGNYCSLGPAIHVFRRNHPTDRLSQHPFFFNSKLGLLEEDTVPSVTANPLVIGHDVWIGGHVIVNPGCRIIGDSSIVASGSVLTTDVPPFAIFGGVPAKLLRWRIPVPLQMAWLQSRWWLRPISDLSNDIPCFLHPMESGRLPNLSS